MKFLSILFISLFIFLLQQSCRKDCYEDPELVIWKSVQNILLKDFNQGMTYIGYQYYPSGTPVIVSVSVNLFYSIVRRNPISGSPITFFWSESVLPAISPGSPCPFSELQNGETVTCYFAVFNTRPNFNFDCIVKEAKEVKSTIDVVVKVENGKIVQTKKVQQTQYNVPAGKYAVFNLPIEYQGPGMYNLNLAFDLNGKLVATDTLVLEALGM